MVLGHLHTAIITCNSDSDSTDEEEVKKVKFNKPPGIEVLRKTPIRNSLINLIVTFFRITVFATFLFN